MRDPERFFQTINTGLDDVLYTMDKVQSIYHSVQKMSPMVKQMLNSLREMEAFQQGMSEQAETRSKAQASQARPKYKRRRKTF